MFGWIWSMAQRVVTNFPLLWLFQKTNTFTEFCMMHRSSLRCLSFSLVPFLQISKELYIWDLQNFPLLFDKINLCESSIEYLTLAWTDLIRYVANFAFFFHIFSFLKRTHSIFLFSYLFFLYPIHSWPTLFVHRLPVTNQIFVSRWFYWKCL